MLAYRHAFHAGNHADVLKHVVFAEVLRHMAAKDKPFTVLDTHAGAGGYSLESRYAQQNAEADTGIGRLWGRDDLPSALRRFVDLVRSFNGETVAQRHLAVRALAQVGAQDALVGRMQLVAVQRVVGPQQEVRDRRRAGILLELAGVAVEASHQVDEA
jgi:23S rRNA A2030 N6-methylase RlmJ